MKTIWRYFIFIIIPSYTVRDYYINKHSIKSLIQTKLKNETNWKVLTAYSTENVHLMERFH
jgi:hypothetical protein